jgi:hypothetical protein
MSGPIERGGVTVQSWQRVPTTLLQEWTQREKRPRPIYKDMGGGAACCVARSVVT